MNDPQTILIVDNVPARALVLIRILKQEWNVQVAPNGSIALEKAVSNPQPDLILLNVELPGMSGYEVCRRLKELPRTQHIPVVFISSANSEQDEAHGLEIGAVDYLIKPICAPIVKARISNHLALRHAQNALSVKNRELERLASRDALTNLYNRWKMDDCFEHEVQRANRFHRPLSVILIDIDHFKQINDTHGHAVGDSVLMETAELLQSNLRSSDIPCRWGGEEFLVICPETEIDTAIQLAERLREEFATRCFSVAGHQTASFGVAEYKSDRSPGQIFRQADAAMYQAKEKGSNRVEREPTTE